MFKYLNNPNMGQPYYPNQNKPYLNTQTYQPIAQRRLCSVDSISHAYPPNLQKPVTYSTTTETLISPPIYYQPVRSYAHSGIRKNSSSGITNQVPIYQYINNTPNINPHVAQILNKPKKSFFEMPQAISLGVAFGLFCLGLITWFM